MNVHLAVCFLAGVSAASGGVVLFALLPVDVVVVMNAGSMDLWPFIHIVRQSVLLCLCFCLL